MDIHGMYDRTAEQKDARILGKSGCPRSWKFGIINLIATRSRHEIKSRCEIHIGVRYPALKPTLPYHNLVHTVLTKRRRKPTSKLMCSGHCTAPWRQCHNHLYRQAYHSLCRTRQASNIHHIIPSHHYSPYNQISQHCRDSWRSGAQ